MFPQLAIGAMKTRRFRNAIGLTTLGDADTVGIGVKIIPAIGEVTLGATDVSGVGIVGDPSSPLWVSMTEDQWRSMTETQWRGTS